MKIMLEDKHTRVEITRNEGEELKDLLLLISDALRALGFHFKGELTIKNEDDL